VALSVHLRGHLFLFDKRVRETGVESSGIRLLLIAVFLEAIRIAAVTTLLPAVPLWLLSPLLLALALLSVRFLSGLAPAQLGFIPWREWTATEKSYFVQIIAIANIVFPVVLSEPLRSRLAQPSPAWIVWSSFVPYLFFGFYQEVVYRGLLQTELVRRWGVFAGITAANILYTFGPLHWVYFSARLSLAVPMFAGIFGIGLFFGILFRRSGNLWIVAIAHAIGNAYIVGSLGS